jgi:Brp/Blh family beta-carotene 15,15'-monooxygenase
VSSSTISRAAARPQYFSYVAIAGASLWGLLFPGTALLVLGPLVLAGLLGLGLAHGACDQLVLPAVGPVRGSRRAYLVRFVGGYLGLAAVAGLGWWQWPGGAVGCFFLLTVWHWGSADAPAQPGQRLLWLVHSLLRGALLFAVPMQRWPTEIQHSVNGLLVLAGAAPLAPSWFAGLAAGLGPAVVVGHLLLWGCYAAQRETRHWLTDMGEVGLLTGLFVALPPLLALGVYFVFWHSLQHILRLNRVFGYPDGESTRLPWVNLGKEVIFFIRRALPSLLLSLVVPAGLYWLLPARLAAGDALLGIVVVTAAILTLPHALLVSLALDSPKHQVCTSKTTHPNTVSGSQ